MVFEGYVWVDCWAHVYGASCGFSVTFLVGLYRPEFCGALHACERASD